MMKMMLFRRDSISLFENDRRFMRPSLSFDVLPIILIGVRQLLMWDRCYQPDVVRDNE